MSSFFLQSVSKCHTWRKLLYCRRIEVILFFMCTEKSKLCLLLFWVCDHVKVLSKLTLTSLVPHLTSWKCIMHSSFPQGLCIAQSQCSNLGPWAPQLCNLASQSTHFSHYAVSRLEISSCLLKPHKFAIHRPLPLLYYALGNLKPQYYHTKLLNYTIILPIPLELCTMQYQASVLRS